jgi:hypothetical protein
VARQREIDAVADDPANQDFLAGVIVPRARFAAEVQHVVLDPGMGIGPQDPFKFERFGHRARLLPIGMPVELRASPLRRI